jgi:hypothetical protein
MHLQPVYRVTVYVPPESLETVLAAADEAAPMRIGRYEGVAHWSASGTERFRPMAGADPTVGTPGVESRVPTVLLEVVIPRDDELLERVLQAVVATHPWEEPAIFVDESRTPAQPS